MLTGFPFVFNIEITEQKGGRDERMPTYDYRCPKCNKKFSLVLSIGDHDAGKAKCPKCGGKKLDQILSAFQVKTSKKS